MLIRFFKKSYLVQYFALLLLIIILWLGALIRPQLSPLEAKSVFAPLFLLVQGSLGSNPRLHVIVAMLLVLFGAILFNYSLARFDLVPKNTFVPALVYAVLLSHAPGLLCLHPAAFPALFTVLILFYLFQVYTEEEAYAQIYNIGLLIGFSSMFYLPYIFFILFIWLTFIVYRLYSWREWMIVLSGMITPYLFLFTFYFLTDQHHQAFLALFGHISTLTGIDIDLELSILNYITSILIILLFLWSVFLLVSDIQEKVISLRKRYWSVFWLFAMSIATYFLSHNFFASHQVFLLIAMAVFLAYGFSQIKKLLWIEILWGLLILLIVINNLWIAF